MNKKWECYPKNETLAKQIAQEHQISELLAEILINRGVEASQIERFLHPTRNDFHDPFLMPNMEKAVERILRAMEQKEKIVIYGDYDVDGITSITVLKKFFADRGITVDWYIPNRLDEGYGLNKDAIDTLRDYNLMITVDCGISGIEEVAYAMSLGIDVVVTDHHEPTEVLPKAIAVVDAKRKDNQYPFNQLAGVGVCFKLIQAISIKLELDAKEYLKYLDIVCVGTISDIVPLVDENRVIAKLGLLLVAQTKNIGLYALLSSIGYKKIDSTSVSFGVAPRINACGRMGHEKEALNLFLTDSAEEAKAITERLNAYNAERQVMEKKIFEEAVNMIEASEKDKAGIILGSENWHHGVIGIVSSKVTDLYFKPSVLICFEGEEGKGSGRSIPGFDLHHALTECSQHLTRFGGHSMAVGVAVRKSEFEDFKTEFENFLQNSDVRDIIPIVRIDEEVNLKQIDLETVKQIELLEPFGEANKMPVFLFKHVKIYSIRTLSEGKHLKLAVKEDQVIVDAIGFNLGNLADEYTIEDYVDIVGTLEVNRFNGMEQIQINLKEIRKSY